MRFRTEYYFTSIMSSFESSKKSFAAYKGHLNRAVKAFEAVLKVKPRPTMETLGKCYVRVQKQLDSLFTSADNMITYLESYDSTEEHPLDVQTELSDLNQYYDNLLTQQCDIESRYTAFQASCTAPAQTPTPASASLSSTSEQSNSKVRLTALQPPSWNGNKADFYTWQRKFIHIMEEAKLNDELTQLCYLQNPRTIPSEYQQLISDCSNISEVWDRLEERVPKETIKYEIISQFRNLQPLPSRKSPAMLRDFANEISLFCRRMSDLGLQKDNYSCIIFHDVYERLGHDITMRYRSKVELKREMMSMMVSDTTGNSVTQPTIEVFEDLDSLCKFIRSEATTLELTTASTSFDKTIPQKKFNIVQAPDDLGKNYSDSYAPRERLRCILGCETPHRLVDCSCYMNWDVEKRLSFIKTSSRCYVCLANSHAARNCARKKGGWKCKFCFENSHHWTLCFSQNSQSTSNTELIKPTVRFQQTEENTDSNKPNLSARNSTNTAASNYCCPRNVETRFMRGDEMKPKDFSPMVVAEVRDSSGIWVRANCFLDTGSNSSLVRSKFAKRLMLHGSGVSDVQFDVAGGGTHYEQAEEFEIHIRPLHGKESYLILATGIKTPCSKVQPISSDIFTKHGYLEEFRNQVHIGGGEIDILIGSDYAPLIIAKKCISSPVSPDDSPSVAITRLGSYIYGGLSSPPSIAVNNVVSVNHLNKKDETDDLRDFFYGDVIGVKSTSLCVCTDKQIAESAFIKHVRATTKINEDGRVCIQMPWKPGFPQKLPNNFYMAKEQMIRREKQLLKHGKIERYNQEIKKLVDRGVVRILDPQEAEKAPEESSWYLNHHMVERPERDTTKLRIVFNSAATFMGISLNDAFEKGPDYTNSLFRCFLRWRMHRIAVSGDMEKMFNQIATLKDDQRFHRFLWRYGDISSPVLIFQWLRVLFGDKPSPDLAGFAIRFLAEKYKSTHPAGAAVLEDSTYVDDVGFSVENIKEAHKVINEIDEILHHGKFSIKCWNSNAENADQCQDQNIVNVLGHTWNKTADVIGIKPKELTLDENEFTKRNLMGLVARLWDPIGYLIPVTIKYRMDLQKIWEEGLSWDEPINAEQKSIWKDNILEMQKLQSFTFSRCLKPECSSGPPQLHVFCDGGDYAYGTCVFLRWPTPTGIQLTLAAAKAFVAPLKHKTTPRIELMGAVAMSRLVIEVEAALTYQFEYKRFWTDSTVVIYWLLSISSRYKSFISSRIQEFQDSHISWKDEIRYVPSKDNPADCLTKSISVEELEAWHNGKACEFLKLEEEFWPANVDLNELDIHPMKSILEEKPATTKKMMKKRRKKIGNKKTTCSGQSNENLKLMSLHKSEAETSTEELGDEIADAFSSWPELRKAMSFVKQALSSRSFNIPLLPTPESLKAAERSLFFICQKNLRADLDQTKRRFLKFNPVFDEEGLIRGKGRLEKTNLDEENKYPILLPGEHPIVHLFALYHHRRLLHQGYRVVIANVVNLGIIIGGARELLKYIAAKCFFCRIRRRNLLQQQMGILPSFRIQEKKSPFASVAVDFFGNLKIKQSRNVSIKGSVMIVTCMTTRCIHLELCTTIDTNSFLRAWRRFTSVRGIHPNHVFSDCGGTFKSGSTFLKEWINNWDRYVIRNEFQQTSFEFDWKFNIPTASHMNGVVESLINSVRKGLDAVVMNYTRNILSFEEWATVLSEITYIINSRPLFPDGDPWLFKCITANDILHPYGQPTVPQFAPEESTNLVGMLRNVQGKVESFWSCWLRHIPPQLNARNKWFHPRSNLEKGDYVLLLEPGMKGKTAPRTSWKKAIVVDTHPGDDGLVRSVTIQDSSHNRYKRPISKLCLIATRAELEQ